MPLSTYTQGAFTFTHAAQVDALYTVYNSTQIKAFFDSQATELKTNHNGVITVLGQTTAGDSGAENIGSATIVGVTGSTVYAQMANIYSQLINIVLGQIPDGSLTDTKLSNTAGQIKDTVTTHLADYVRQPAYGQTTGSANTYVFASTPALPALVDGVSAYLDINVANTGASTLNWDGKGAKAIVDGKGNALIAGKMPLNSIIGVRYNASTGNFQLLGEGGEYGTATAADVTLGKTIGTDAGIVTGTGANAKRYATSSTGSINCTSASQTKTISGLGFTPRIVIADCGATLLSTEQNRNFASINNGETDSNRDPFIAGNASNGVKYQGVSAWNADGFSMYFYRFGSGATVTDVTWYAFE
jgi:hypothetical protein